MATVFTQDPASKLDYTWNWVNRLAVGETIATATFTASGVTASTGTHDDTTTTTRVSGGTAGVAGSVTCHIVTSVGQEDDWTFHFRIEET